MADAVVRRFEQHPDMALSFKHAVVGAAVALAVEMNGQRAVPHAQAAEHQVWQSVRQLRVDEKHAKWRERSQLKHRLQQHDDRAS